MSAASICRRVFADASYADILLQETIRNASFSSEDRSLLTELVNGTIRWKLTLEYWLRRAYRGRWEKMPEMTRWHLIIALYQIRFSERIPDYAVVHEAVHLAGKNNGDYWARVVNGVLRNILRHPESLSLPSGGKAEDIAIQWSHPEWLIRNWLRQFGGEKTLNLCRADNQRPRFGIRVNAMKTDRQAVVESAEIAPFAVRISDLLPEFLVAERVAGLPETELFRGGAISLQDESAGLASRLLNPEKGDVILDMASAPGGKATHMAELCREQCLILAMDVHPQRLAKVRDYQNRLGLKKIFPILGNAREPLPFRSADKILLDAPCTGLGVMAKRAELRWFRNRDDLEVLRQLQLEMLARASEIVRPGGVILYSTCSVMREENEEVVEKFIGDNREMKIDSAAAFLPDAVVTKEGFARTWPDVHGTDGAFAARLRKIG